MHQTTILIRLSLILDIPQEEWDNFLNDEIYPPNVRKIEHLIEKKGIDINSTQIIHLEEKGVNANKCAVCGIWITNPESPKPLLGLTTGSTVNNKTYCDEHLPKNHPLAF